MSWSLSRYESTQRVSPDGVHFAIEVVRPPDAGRYPTLIHRTPYDRRTAQSYWYRPPEWYAQRGFAVVVEDVRGRYDSGGRFEPLIHEAEDSAGLAAWAAGQHWSNGRIGMFGYSYPGLLQFLASAACDLIDAIAPALAPKGLGEGALVRDGVVAQTFLLTWADQLGGLKLEESGFDINSVFALERLNGVPPERLRRCLEETGTTPWAARWLEANFADPAWTDPRMAVDHERVRAHTLNIVGLYDTFSAGGLEHWDALAQAASARGARTDRLAIGPWTHHPVRGPAQADQQQPSIAAWDIDERQVAFFDHLLDDGEPLDGDAVEIAVIGLEEPLRSSQWPPPARRLEWWLASGGSARSARGDGSLTPHRPTEARYDTLIYDHGDPVPSRGGDGCGAPELFAMGAADQTEVERRSDVLVYTSEPLEATTVIVGEVDVSLALTTVDPVGQWIVRLCRVDPTGASLNIAETAFQARTTPETVHAVQTVLTPVAFAIRAGDRLRLQVTNGSSPRWRPLWCGDTPLVQRSRVHHGGQIASSITVPVVD